MRRIVLLLIAFAAPFCLVSASVHAQAPRTWVSGFGDDANPCSRTAPCKTFAGAISKTAVAGQIHVLDSGDYGAVTITKSVTIDGRGNFAGVLATLGSNGIVINAAADDFVILRGLTIDGSGSGGNGILFLAGNVLYIEDCVVDNFAQKGIDIHPTTPTLLYIRGTIVRNNGAGAGGGIRINPGAGVTVKASLDNVRMEHGIFGLKTEGAGVSNVSVHNSVATGNSAAGFSAITAGAVLNIENSVATHNGGPGVSCSAGATVRISNMSIFDNAGGDTAGGCSSFLNNAINGPVTGSFQNNDIGTVVILTPISQQ